MHDLGDVQAQSQPYAYWPAWLATDAGSGLTTIDSIAGHPICIVGSSVGRGLAAAASRPAPRPRAAGRASGR